MLQHFFAGLSHWAWAVVLAALIFTKNRNITAQWIVSIAVVAVLIAAAACNHESRWMISLYIAVALIGFPIVAVQQYRKSRRPRV